LLQTITKGTYRRTYHHRTKREFILTYINKREDKDANADLFKIYEGIDKDKPTKWYYPNGTED
jgi:hypothetical protein